jgi:hypothetical protein
MQSWNGVATVFAQGLLAIVFLVSLTSKVRDMEGFRHTVAAFGVLPPALTAFAAPLLAAAEAVVVVLLLGGLLPADLWPAARPLAVSGLVLAVVLLVAYTAALVAVRMRRARVSCNCFGASAAVSWYDVVRNGLFGLTAGLGLVADPSALSAADRALVVLAAAPAALLLINFADVVSVARRSSVAD